MSCGSSWTVSSWGRLPSGPAETSFLPTSGYGRNGAIPSRSRSPCLLPSGSMGGGTPGTTPGSRSVPPGRIR